MCLWRGCEEPVGLRPDAEEKHTLNLSFNINLHFRIRQKAEKATAPPLPLQFVMPVSHTQALRLRNRDQVFYIENGGVVSSVVTSETRSGVSVFSGCALRVPEAKRGRVPCDGAEEIYVAPPPEHA